MKYLYCCLILIILALPQQGLAEQERLEPSMQSIKDRLGCHNEPGGDFSLFSNLLSVTDSSNHCASSILYARYLAEVDSYYVKNDASDQIFRAALYSVEKMNNENVMLNVETLSGLNRNVNELGVDGLIESTQVRSKDALGFSVISGEL